MSRTTSRRPTSSRACGASPLTGQPRAPSPKHQPRAPSPTGQLKEPSPTAAPRPTRIALRYLPANSPGFCTGRSPGFGAARRQARSPLVAPIWEVDQAWAGVAPIIAALPATRACPQCLGQCCTGEARDPLPGRTLCRLYHGPAFFHGPNSYGLVQCALVVPLSKFLHLPHGQIRCCTLARSSVAEEASRVGDSVPRPGPPLTSPCSRSGVFAVLCIQRSTLLWLFA